MDFESRRARTELVRKMHRGPLTVQSPFHPEGETCHVYLLHPPGGVAGGDSLTLRAQLSRGAHTLLTTPAATKIYRSAGPVSSVAQELFAESGCDLEWLPQETLVFSGARARMSTRVNLGRGARFIGWEAMCLGRPASGEVFADGAIRQDFEIWVDGVPLLLERNRFDAHAELLKAGWGLSGLCSLASIIAYPCEAHLVEAARAVCGRFSDQHAAATAVDGALVGRIISADMRYIRAWLNELWSALRPRLLGRPAVAPRIWAT
ncbi:MAG: urease accessory protein [Chromatiales bacterium]|jgi:urease accessory protein|nr:urease accessory protein [Chromatiales bacterium]